MTNIELEILTAVKTACREFIRKDEIDWEQRRYEIARDVLAGMSADGNIDVEIAVKRADKLIAELKKK